MQADERWKDKALTGIVDGVYKSSTIGLIGCSMTSGGMVASITPGTLWDVYNMKDYLCVWSKIPTHRFITYSVSTGTQIANKLFAEIVVNNNPVILYGDDGLGGKYSTHFAVAYGFVGTVSVDVDGGYSLMSYDLSQFKVLDPSTLSGYGNHTNTYSFNNRFPIQNLRLTERK